MAEWYIRGSFTDEYGREHHSGHRLKIDYWEVLNEQEELGHSLSPEIYTALYDAIVARLKAVDPSMKFSALALSDSAYINYFEYFLNARNHQPGVTLDMVSYHQYVFARTGKTPQQWQEDMFEQTDRFLLNVKRIERIRTRLSPTTKTFVSEFGVRWQPEDDNTFAPLKGGKASSEDPAIPDGYWTLSASVFAYGYLGALREGVDLFAAAELVNYPGQLAGTTLIHWRTGEPNAVYRVVKMLHEELPSGGMLLQTEVKGQDLEAQAFRTPRGERVLLINKTLAPITITLSGLSGATLVAVDQTTNSSPPRQEAIEGGKIVLRPQAVAIVSPKLLEVPPRAE